MEHARCPGNGFLLTGRQARDLDACRCRRRRYRDPRADGGLPSGLPGIG